MSQLALIKCLSYDQEQVDIAVASALENLGGMSRFVKPGQKVILKVSLLTGAAPEKAITTHPALVKAVVRQVQKAGGVAYIGDLPANSLSEISDIFRKTGLTAVARETGARLTSLKKGGVHRAKLKNKQVPEVLLSSEVLEADVVINLPKLKTHQLMLFTGAIKNLYGVVAGFNKSKYHFQASHPKELARLLVDIYEIVRPALTIMDGIIAMEGDGPSNGLPRLVGAIIAGSDAVAVDAVASEIIGYRSGEILTTKIAAKRKLGQGSLSKIEIKGAAISDLKAKDFKKTGNIYNILKMIPVPFFRLGKFLGRFVKIQPEIFPEICILCGDCARHCPAGAISQNKDGLFEINHRRCILCFCCSEVCPAAAIKIKRNWLANKLTRVKTR